MILSDFTFYHLYKEEENYINGVKQKPIYKVFTFKVYSKFRLKNKVSIFSAQFSTIENEKQLDNVCTAAHRLVKDEVELDEARKNWNFCLKDNYKRYRDSV